MFIALTLATPVHAHPGRTDAQGGHVDTGTGQYHYHHGEEAHQHYDIDGNGTLDCPLSYIGVDLHDQTPIVGIATASCVALAITAGAITKSKEQ